MKSYTGVEVLTCTKEIVGKIFSDKKIEISEEWKKMFPFYENQFIVVKGEGSQSAVTRVKGNYLHLVLAQNVSGLDARNKEQLMALDALLDPTVKVVVLTGTAGSGKTILSLASAISQIESGTYKKLLLTRIMTQVGEQDIGILPGEIEQKMHPYLRNYLSNLEILFKGRKIDLMEFANFYNAEFVPFQLIRGASFHNTFVICDEAQTLGYHEMLTLGTRISEGSKLIILGDMRQRDTDIPEEKTGIYKFTNSTKAKCSKFSASIQLLKSERGEVASLFADIFETQ